MEDLSAKIRAKRKEKKMTQQNVADALGISRVSVAQWELNQTKPTVENLNSLANLLGVTPDYFLSGSPSIKAGEVPLLKGDVRVAPIKIPDFYPMPKDVPVMGTAACSLVEGAFQLDNNIIDYVRRPIGLSTAKDVYALYVEGDSMEPKFIAGDLVFVHPGRPAHINSLVVVQYMKEDGGYPQAMIGVLHKRTSEVVEIQKYNPEAIVRIDARTVQFVHRIVSNNELFGL